MTCSGFTVRTKEDLLEAIERFGFLPFFSGSIPGFSLEEHAAADVWYSAADDTWKAWDWKGPVIRESRCAYGKFFENKAVFISREWFPDFANYRRDGYDFDARFDDGLASFRDRELFELVDANAPVLSRELKRIGNYRKGGKKGFETSITRLQAQGLGCAIAAICFVVISLVKTGRFDGIDSFESFLASIKQPFAKFEQIGLGEMLCYMAALSCSRAPGKTNFIFIVFRQIGFFARALFHFPSNRKRERLRFIRIFFYLRGFDIRGIGIIRYRRKNCIYHRTD